MRIYYDADVDALYLEFRPLEPGAAEARPLSDDIIADYGPDGVLAGLEIISASKVLGRAEERIVLEITPARVVAAPAA